MPGETRVPAERQTHRKRAVSPRCGLPMMKIPALRAGGFSLGSHRRAGVPRTLRSRPGSTAGSAGGGKALNPGWSIVQNKANFEPGERRLTAVRKRGCARK
jgi:hypothetical protein